MRKVHEKSVILGIGIGIIITSIAGLIYSGGAGQDLSEQEIKRLAKSYGMVEQVPLINGNAAGNTADSSDMSDHKASGNTAANAAQPTGTPSAETSGGNTAADNSEAVTQKDGEPANASENNKASSGESERKINIEVKPGYNSADVADLLLEKGVITSVKDFNVMLDSYNASTKIKIGTYQFKKNDNLDYIVKTICILK